MDPATVQPFGIKNRPPAGKRPRAKVIVISGPTLAHFGGRAYAVTASARLV